MYSRGKKKPMLVSKVVGLASTCQLVFRPFIVGTGKEDQTVGHAASGRGHGYGAKFGARLFEAFLKKGRTGRLFYEAEMTVNGHSKDVLMDAGGVIVEVEEQIAMGTLPADVQDVLRAKAGIGEILTVESITKHDKLVAYEATILTKGKRSEIQVDPQGKPLGHEE